MMLTRILPQVVAKEVRALLPLWLGAMVVLLFVPALARRIGAGDGTIQVWGLLIYGGASFTLGALSIGHEYSNRTLTLLLSQPVSRARVFVVKQVVLLIMLLILADVVWNSASLSSIGVALLVVLAVLGGLFVTPWLTMLSRNPLAGAVFTGPIPALTWLLINLYVARPLQFVFFAWTMLGLCAVAAVQGWRTFMRLEAVEGPDASVSFRLKAEATRGTNANVLPAMAAARTQYPIWLLVKKELALQQMALVVAALYLVGWLLSLFGDAGGQFRDGVFAGLTVLYSGHLALLIGALASAEERQLGTLEWQGLLPIAWWKQWAAKVVTVLALSTLLTVALPFVLLSTSGGGIRINDFYACAALLLTTAGLYVSSLNSSGMRALLVALPVSLIVLFAGIMLSAGLYWRLTPLSLAVLAAFVAIALYFALLNHRSSERSVRRIGLQVFVMAGCLFFAGALATLMR